MPKRPGWREIHGVQKQELVFLCLNGRMERNPWRENEEKQLNVPGNHTGAEIREVQKKNNKCKWDFDIIILRNKWQTCLCKNSPNYAGFCVKALP